MKRILAGLVDLIFPPLCIGCGTLLNRSSIPFCDSCFSGIRLIHSPLCPRCGIPFQSEEGRDHLCGECIESEPHFTAARAAGRYDTSLLHVIHRFKYGEKISIGETLGRFMAELDYGSFRIRDYTLIIPVPLHRKRLRERSFNQSLILAREISKRHSIPMNFEVLKRKVHTEPQVKLGKAERGPNVRRAFEVVGKKAVAGEKILLVDDVYTTGSTVKECARVLRAGGAAEVAVLTLARAV